MADLDIRTQPCRSCEAPIFLARNIKTGTRIPLDVGPDRNEGTYTVARGFDGLTATHQPVTKRFGRTLYRPHPAECKRRRPTVAVHAFELDETVPADFSGRRWCVCGVFGEAGDKRHPTGALPLATRRHPPVDAGVKAVTDRILGERE